MASYLKASIKRSYAESFLTELERNENQFFFFVAKGTTWANESSPTAYSDTVASEYQVMNEIIGYKKLNPQNVLFALPRYEWQSGEVYSEYSDSADLFNEDDPAIFYVVTDANHVYKCLDNNGGSPSTVKPGLVITSPFTTPTDGYKWKYVATIREGNLPYELTDYVPVEVATLSSDTETQNQYNSQVEAVDGELTRIESLNGANPGVYPYAITESVLNSITPYNVLVADFEVVNDTTKRVRVTDLLSRQNINNYTNATPSNLIGYVMRVNASQVNPAEINNYGVITAVSNSVNEIIFTVQNDAIDFTVSPTTQNAKASVDFIPYVKIVGDGEGAYAFPNISADKKITSVSLLSGGRGYSNVIAEITSAVNGGTTHPVLTPVLSPKGGHGSNILKELNVKDIIIIVEIGEEDAATFVTGSTYRQFGIIRNPVLSDGTLAIAGTENPYYRDITLYREDGVLPDAVHFDGSEGNYIIGSESYSLAKVQSIKSAPNTQTNRLTLKTLNSSGKFISRLDRFNDYTVTISTGVAANFEIGERITQTVPAGSVITTNSGSGISYGYNLTAIGQLIGTDGNDMLIRNLSSGNFVTGYTVRGTDSGATGSVSAVVATNGELVRVTKSGSGSVASFVSNTSGLQKIYRVVELSQPYFDLDTTPVYSGLYRAEIATSVSGQTGTVDFSSAPLSQNSYSPGDTVHQGVTGQFGHYATGKVYKWEYINPTRGVLYLTDVVGKFKTLSTHGVTGSAFDSYVMTSITVPDIERTSGEILYIDNVRPITRGVGQKEEFRLRLGF